MKQEKIKKTRHERILDITLIALFAALSYIALAILFIPFYDMYIHFGNLIVVLAALLIGGWQGGLAGSIGMGFFDIFSGLAVSSPKTFILKFLIGLTVGAVYKFFNSKESFPSVALYVSGTVSLMISVGLLTFTFVTNHAYTGRSAILAPIFLVIGVFCIVAGLLKKKFSKQTASAIIGASAGMFVNLVGEIVWKLVSFSLAGSDIKAAFTSAVLAQASTLINAGIAIVGGVALFCVLKKPFSKIKSAN